jgi:hypothetical protein
VQPVQPVAHPGALRSRIRRADRGIGCQWKSVRHDPVRQTRKSGCRMGTLGVADPPTTQDESRGCNTWVFSPRD